jgi:WD40 repeat protein
VRDWVSFFSSFALVEMSGSFETPLMVTSRRPNLHIRDASSPDLRVIDSIRYHIGGSCMVTEARLSLDNSKLAYHVHHFSEGDEHGPPPNHICVYSLNNGRQGTMLLFKRVYTCVALCFNGDGSRLIFGEDNGKVSVVDILSDSVMSSFTASVTRSTPLFLASDDLAIVSCFRTAVIFWNESTGEEMCRMGWHGANICCMSVSRNSSTVVSADVSGVLIFWDSRTYLQGGKVTLASAVAKASFTNSGHLLVGCLTGRNSVFVIDPVSLELSNIATIPAMDPWVHELHSVPFSNLIICSYSSSYIRYAKWLNMDAAASVAEQWTDYHLENDEAYCCSSLQSQQVILM